jgi:hypothetical protein
MPPSAPQPGSTSGTTSSPSDVNSELSGATMKIGSATWRSAAICRSMMRRPSSTSVLLTVPPNRRAFPPARIAAATNVLFIASSNDIRTASARRSA